MRFSLKRRLLSLVYPLLKLFRMPDQIPQGPEFTADEAGVDLYLELLQLKYETRAEAERLRIVCATVWKQDKVSQHEYIVFKAVNPESVLYYFLFERMRHSLATTSDTSLAPASTRPSTPLPRSSVGSRSIASFSPTPSLASLDSLSKDRKAKDVVRWLPTPSKKPTDLCMGTLTFPQEPAFHLYHVAALAAAVHANHDSYRLFSQNCYFMAGVMVAALESACGRQKGKSDNSSTFFSEGAWYGMGKTFDPQNPLIRKVVKDVGAKYDQTVLQFENELTEKVRSQEERVRETQLAREERALARQDRMQAQELREQAQELENASKAREERTLAKERELEELARALAAQSAQLSAQPCSTS